MRVILDGVFNHCGSFNKWLDRERIYAMDPSYEKGAFIEEESPYHTFFKFYEEGEWPYNTCYNGWWGHDTLPKLNYEESEKLVRYIMRIARKWVSPPYNVDGWRLDVAADLGFSQEFNHKFWEEFRRNVKEANPDAIILAEHYGDPTPWISGGQWDTVMNYDAFMEPVSWFVTGVDKHSDVARPDLRGNSNMFFARMTGTALPGRRFCPSPRLKQIWDKKLLYKGFKIVPYCPRCGTPLSSHEVAQGYKAVKERSAIARFKVIGEDAYFLAWTTTPWTLPSNVALCVNPEETY